jgi:hypothetical protein
VLRLENNRLEALLDNMGELPSLLKLDVSTNSLRQLPSSMGRLKCIQRIDAVRWRLLLGPAVQLQLQVMTMPPVLSRASCTRFLLHSPAAAVRPTTCWCACRPPWATSRA